MMATAGALESTVNGTAMQGVLMDQQLQSYEGVVTELRMPWYAFRSNEWCKAGKCLRALCQSTTGPAQQEAPNDPDSDRFKYCYDDLEGDGTNDYIFEWIAGFRGSREAGPCDMDHFCAAPGKRHGHSSTSVLIQGDTTMLLVVGGEEANWGTDSQTLTMDLHVVYFTAAFGTWAKIPLVDKDEAECTGDGTLCPQARREAAIKMMGNDGSSNGKLLMYGGLAAGSLMTTSVGRAYLEGATQNNLIACTDLWYLDMASLSVGCVSGAEVCQPLRWILIDVPGTKPMGRWGAGMVLDPSDNLYIIGGSTFDSTAKEFKVLSDIFIFQLRDPYYKYCSATGAGLFSAVAGISTPFYVQCRDSFGEPADSASFQVDITGKEGQPGMKPAPFPIGKGLYKCEYAAFVTGQYEIRIFVGRGGSEYMDLIEGIDTEPSNEEHDFEFNPASRNEVSESSQKYFSLSVSPADTNAGRSEAVGTSITANTAGAIGTFLITAKDVFGNRRPGGDTVTALMELWNDVTSQVQIIVDLPETGSVFDNKDGSYAVSFRITKAGNYQHSISLAGTVGTGTPVFLRVSSDLADISRTYVYGELKKLETGKASTIYIQTRDQFGNNLRYTSEEKPCTGYPLSEETCDQLIDYQLCRADEFQVPCPADEIETSVGKSLVYQMGPTGSTKDADGDPFYGLYQITIYPFVAASFLPMVYHNDTYVACYFDSADLVGTAEADPGWQLANECASRNDAQVSRRGMSSTQLYRKKNRRGGGWNAAEPMGVVTVQDRPALKENYEEGRSEFGISSRHRRAIKSISWADTKLEVAQQFVEPNTAVLKSWLTLAPILCGLVGLICAIFHALLDFYEHRRDSKVHALIVEMEAEFDADEVSEEKVLTNPEAAEILVLEDLPSARSEAEVGLNGLPAQETTMQNGACPECDGGGCVFCNVSRGNDTAEILSVPKEISPSYTAYVPSGSLGRSSLPTSLRQHLEPSALQDVVVPFQTSPNQLKATDGETFAMGRLDEIPEALSPSPPPLPAED